MMLSFTKSCSKFPARIGKKLLALSRARLPLPTTNNTCCCPPFRTAKQKSRILSGLSFQTPLAMLTLERIGLMTVEDYRQKRRIILFVLAVVYVIVSPTPDPWTMLLFWIPMAGLYELGIWLCKWAPRGGGREE